MEYREFTAKTREEAITAACMELGVTSDRLDYIVAEEGSNGFFGLGSKDAVIRARIREENEEAPAAPAVEESAPRIKTLDEIEEAARAAAAKAGFDPEEAPRREKRERDRGSRNRRNRRKGDDSHRTYEEEPKDYTPSEPKPEREVVPRTEEEVAVITADAEKFLTDVFAAMDLEVTKDISYDQETGTLSCEFSGEEMGILIGKRGQTLDSLQYLTSLAVNKNQKDYVRVKLDTEEYRRRRKDTLENLAHNIAGKVKRTHRAVVLEPMNPYERRIIHSALQSNRNVDTYSEGDEPFRRVVVTPKKGNN